MPETNAQSIADRFRGMAGARVFWWVFALAVAGGLLGAWYVAAAGLTLSHYDARAHLVVARRVADSLTPGWRQFGAVWLPLPHLLNALPVQWDWAYRSGGIAVALNVVILSAGVAGVAQRLFVRTGSLVVSLTPPALILANPNVLHLQGMPMTEPALMGLALASLAALDSWVRSPSRSFLVGWLLAALVLTRYEGWLIAAGLLAVAGAATLRRAPVEFVRLVLPVLLAVSGFLVLSWASTGRWVLSLDFFVPDPEALNQPLKAARLVAEGVVALGSWPLAAAACVGVVVCIVAARRGISALLPLALSLSGLLPIAAFTAGHPVRIRYMVPLIAACGILAGVAVAAAPRRVRGVGAAALILAALWLAPPTDRSAPMVLEAQWGVPLRLERAGLIEALRGIYDGTPILASMGSGRVGFMHEASSIGLRISNFLHEGNGDLWAEALRSPRRSVRWVLIEERPEGGDMLAARARTDADFLSGFRRVAEGGGLALYQRIGAAPVRSGSGSRRSVPSR